MWKWLRLVTLVVVTSVLTVITYPTWRGFLAPNEVEPIESDSYLAVVAINNSTDFELTLRTIIDSTFGNSGTSTPSSPEIQLQQSVANVPIPPEKGQPAFLIFAGQFRQWADYCLGLAGVRELVASELPSAVDQLAGLGTAARYLYIEHGIATCYVPNSRIWTTQDANLVMRSPPLLLALPADEDPRVKVRDNEFCARVLMTYGVQMTLDYVYPTPTPADTPSRSQDVLWQNCNPQVTTANQHRSFAHLDLVTARVTDLSAVVRANRNTFFAGVFAGVLGALAIEILTSGFDLVGSITERSRRHREEREPPPVPPLSPPDPDPDTEQDDQDQPPPWNPDDSSYM